MRLAHFILAVLCLFVGSAAAKATYTAQFALTLTPGNKVAAAEIRISPGTGYVRQMTLKMPPEQFSKIAGDGVVDISGAKVTWQVPKTGGRLTYSVLINHARSNGAFDALMTPHWAIFRGDKVFPKAKVKAKGSSLSTLTINIPTHWHANTGYERFVDGVHRFNVVERGRRFDQPSGWMIAGKIANRVELIAGCKVIVAGPEGLGMRRQDMLAFLNYNLPELKRAFGRLPPTLLIVSGPDPMWRGGLSGPNSLYLHMDRPMISENGTSSLLHELTHSITRIRGSSKAPGDADWIAESLAEFYGIEAMRRSGGSSTIRFQETLKDLGKWAAKVKTLRTTHSTGEVTARGVLLLIALDQEIQKASAGKKNLDAVTRILAEKASVTNKDFTDAVRSVLGRDAQSLNTPLLR
jgi:hypothetical protein